jgi:hypothetical protein
LQALELGELTLLVVNQTRLGLDYLMLSFSFGLQILQFLRVCGLGLLLQL